MALLRIWRIHLTWSLPAERCTQLGSGQTSRRSGATLPCRLSIRLILPVESGYDLGKGGGALIRYPEVRGLMRKLSVVAALKGNDPRPLFRNG